MEAKQRQQHGRGTGLPAGVPDAALPQALRLGENLGSSTRRAASCGRDTVTAQTPRFKRLQWDVFNCKASRNAFLFPPSLVSTGFRVLKHTPLSTATNTFCF